jgi:hypothetical protein
MGFPPSNRPFWVFGWIFFPPCGRNFPLCFVIFGGFGARMASIFIYLGAYFAVFGGFCPVFGRDTHISLYNIPFAVLEIQKIYYNRSYRRVIGIWA